MNEKNSILIQDTCKKMTEFLTEEKLIKKGHFVHFATYNIYSKSTSYNFSNSLYQELKSSDDFNKFYLDNIISFSRYSRVMKEEFYEKWRELKRNKKYLDILQAKNSTLVGEYIEKADEHSDQLFKNNPEEVVSILFDILAIIDFQNSYVAQSIIRKIYGPILEPIQYAYFSQRDPLFEFGVKVESLLFKPEWIYYHIISQKGNDVIGSFCFFFEQEKIEDIFNIKGELTKQIHLCEEGLEDEIKVYDTSDILQKLAMDLTISRSVDSFKASVPKKTSMIPDKKERELKDFIIKSCPILEKKLKKFENYNAIEVVILELEELSDSKHSLEECHKKMNEFLT